MKAPILLLSAALIFWGWQTEMWLFAIPMAVILAGYHLINWRWDFSHDDFRHIAHLCLIILIIVLVYLLTTNHSIYLVYNILQLFPLVFFPLLAAQTYSINESIDILTLFFIKKESIHFTFNLNYFYFALCIFCAGTANTKSIYFYMGMFVLTSIALWFIRSQRFSPILWVSLILLAGNIGFIGQMGVYQLQQRLEDSVVAWLSNANSIGQFINSETKQTNIGEIGVLKQSNEILFRVASDTSTVSPGLLREATYDKYKSSVWIASNPTFTPIKPDINGKNWRLGNKPTHSSKLTISTTLNKGQGLLRLADGTFEIDELPVSKMEKNKYGTIQVNGKVDAITYQVLFNNNLSLDSLPTEDDLQIAKSEREAIYRIVSQLDIIGKSPQTILQRVDRFFQQNFRYSLKLTGKNNQSTPLSTFLLQTRSGHCEYFATATTLLLRAVGIPSRYAVGYSVQEFSSLENQYIVRSRHAHAWTLAYIDSRWQAFDTTPADWINLENANAPKLAFLCDLWSLFIFKLSGWLRSSLANNLSQYGWWLILSLIFFQLWKLRSHHRVHRLSRKHILTKQVTKSDLIKKDYDFYVIENKLHELGLSRHPSESLKKWINRLKAELPVPDLIEDLALIIELHYRDRYDPQGIEDSERAILKSTIQAWLIVFHKYFHNQ